AHQSKIVPVVQQALRKANIDKKDLTAIAYTQGPGLLGSLLVGSAFAKSIALALDIPLIPINHMQGHLLVHFIDDERIQTPAFPCLGVTVSGGHTQLVLMHDQFKMEILGTTLDDAIGEAFDKCGKRMGLPYPSGPQIDKLAKEGNPHRFTFPIPNLPGYDVSYSGVKTAVINFLSNQEQKDPNFIKLNRNDLCASIQYTLVQIILTKIVKVVKEKKLSHIIIGGGVAANSEIRTQLQNIALKEGWIVSLPPFEYTTDNAAMIGIAAYYKIQKEEFGGFGDPSNARLKYGL
ncbi:MAG: tRNA (adenosine(37)-N6)-threonylcarbamoyltransferase complex transferase subunit TsaD, partial [Flavobacteriaceae bacterium]|nr:tRNA (adenosine(37)-N6)-threonylcarbamoyltransferase complex transferase subunit TsaD [Flavobacteriaceae bacterium]